MTPQEQESAMLMLGVMSIARDPTAWAAKWTVLGIAAEMRGLTPAPNQRKKK